MLENITFGYPQWFVSLCIGLGIIYSLAMYWRDGRFSEYPGWYKWMIGILRFLSSSGIAFLLLSPMIKTITEEQKDPIIVIVEDASASISKAGNENQGEIMDNLESKLKEKYEVKRLHFGAQTQMGKADTFDQKITNLSNAFQYLDENFADLNLGAIIMSTDGIYNEGKNPLYTSTNISAPLYIIAQGDTSKRKDLLVKNVFYNKVAYLGDRFTIQVDISAHNLQGLRSALTVSKIINDKPQKVKTEAFVINKNEFFKTIEVPIDANTPGINKYRISLRPAKGEDSQANNYKDIYIDVLDARQKILIFADGDHPDLGALKSIITNNKNYEIDIKLPEDKNINLLNYDLVILHNLPSQKHPVDNELSTLKRRGIPLLFIAGSTINTPLFNKAQDVITISGNSNEQEEISGLLNNPFALFTLSESLPEKIKRFPPLIAPFGQYSSPTGASILMYQSIKNIPTKYPMIAFKERGNQKEGVWVGEGIWKWRIHDFLENNNYDAVSELVNKTIQYLTTKEDKRKFRVTVSKNIYKENEHILFDAQLFNSNYEMVNTPDVFLIITNKKGKEFDFTFSRKGDYYTLDAGMLPPGKYTYLAKTNFNGEAMQQKGSFAIKDIQLELFDNTARHSLLRSLSQKYNGEVLSMKEVPLLADRLLSDTSIKPILYPSSSTKSIINFWWLLPAILLLLFLEWFLRRYWGSY